MVGWGSDQSVRVSEYTRPEPGSTDHCVRLDDLTFYRTTRGGAMNCTGSAIAMASSGVEDSRPAIKEVIQCHVLAASCKGNVVVNAKLIGRRSEEETQFLYDLLVFISRSGALGTRSFLVCGLLEKKRSAARFGRRLRRCVA